jgi:hypothetical protein
VAALQIAFVCYGQSGDKGRVPSEKLIFKDESEPEEQVGGINKESSDSDGDTLRQWGEVMMH